MVRALRVGAVALATLAALLLLQSILSLVEEELLRGIAWSVTAAGAAVLAWLMRRLDSRANRR